VTKYRSLWRLENVISKTVAANGGGLKMAKAGKRNGIGGNGWKRLKWRRRKRREISARQWREMAARGGINRHKAS
jgi:hypothetical protein